MKRALSLLLFLPFVYCQDFYKKYVGVTFSPYTKYGNALWNSYSTEEIERMLSVVSSKFFHISTYGMGINQWNYNQTWDKADSSAFVARAASNLNNNRRSTVINVAIGINQSETQNYQNAEVNNAFSAATDANQRHSGTVWGIVFTNEYFDTQHVDRAHRYRSFFRLHHVQHVSKCAQSAVDAIGNFYLAVRKEFQIANRDINVIIGETGWPYVGQSYNQSPNNIQNLKSFWVTMGDWAARKAVQTYMFAAIDEPWKKGFSGESHYGWWKRRDDNSEVYIEKVSNREIRG